MDEENEGKKSVKKSWIVAVFAAFYIRVRRKGWMNDSRRSGL